MCGTGSLILRLVSLELGDVYLENGSIVKARMAYRRSSGRRPMRPGRELSIGESRRNKGQVQGRHGQTGRDRAGHVPPVLVFLHGLPCQGQVMASTPTLALPRGGVT